MPKPYLLHMFTPGANVSPFDVNMAYDAGWDAVVPYTAIGVDDVAGLIQDAIFSRGPKGARRTGVFIGGRDMHVAMQMLALAKQAMVPPFEISLFADPSGAFTTAAGVVALAEQHLRRKHGGGLSGKHVLVFGGTGPVGNAAAMMAANSGAHTTIVSHSTLEKARGIVALCEERYGVELDAAYSGDESELADLVARAEVVFAAAKAGVQVLGAERIAAAAKLEVVVDVNAVPPSGVEGLGAQDDGVVLPASPSGALGIGALAVGNVKYQTQQQLLVRMRETEQPLSLGFEQALEQARAHAG